MLDDNTVKNFEQALMITKDPTAAALLVLANGIQDLDATHAHGLADSLGHQICLGIRKGIFGYNADDDSNVLNLMPSADD
jgi:hypothetical protein